MTENSVSGLVKLQQRIARMEAGNNKIGRWLSAALDDETVCAEMKADIRAWFESQGCAVLNRS